MLLLDIILSNGWMMIVVVIVAIILYQLYIGNKKLIEEKNRRIQQELEVKSREAESKLKLQEWAIAELNKFKENEVASIKKYAEKQALEMADIKLQEWKFENETRIRQDAINRSYTVNLGKITEHLVPFHQTFLSQFNPKDARFLGSPIDLIVFDGYADKRDDIIIYLVEVKTGNSKLSDTQKRIKQAIVNGRVRWTELNPDNPFPLSIDTHVCGGKEPEKIESSIDTIYEKVEMHMSRVNMSMPIDTPHLAADDIEKNIDQNETTIKLISSLIKSGYSVNEAIETGITRVGLVFKSEKEKQQFKKKILRNVL